MQDQVLNLHDGLIAGPVISRAQVLRDRSERRLPSEGQGGVDTVDRVVRLRKPNLEYQIK
jgi:hypothetical protein